MIGCGVCCVLRTLSFFLRQKHVVFTKLNVMKMISLIFITVFSFHVCSAPPPSEEAREERILWIESELTRIEKEKQFALFVDHLGIRESSNQWKIINQINCMGKWQFSPMTLKHLGYGYITPHKFQQNPDIFPEELQYQLLIALFKSNEIALRDYMGYIGKTIGGVAITKAGMLAGAHLGGAGSVKLFLKTNGTVNRQDINRTSIKTYLNEFANYNI